MAAHVGKGPALTAQAGIKADAEGSKPTTRVIKKLINRI